MPKAIVLKHLAKEFNIDDYPLRQILRQEFGKPKSGRWSWDDAKDPQLVKIKQFLKQHAEDKRAKKTKPIKKQTPKKKPLKQPVKAVLDDNKDAE